MNNRENVWLTAVAAGLQARKGVKVAVEQADDVLAAFDNQFTPLLHLRGPLDHSFFEATPTQPQPVPATFTPTPPTLANPWQVHTPGEQFKGDMAYEVEIARANGKFDRGMPGFFNWDVNQDIGLEILAWRYAEK